MHLSGYRNVCSSSATNKVRAGNMKNYDSIERQHMEDAHEGAVMFWISLVVCIVLAVV